MPPRTRAKMVAVVASAAAVIVALLPVGFTSDGVAYSCGSAISAAFHRWPGCRDAAPPYLIGAVVIAAVGAVLALSMANKDH